MTGNFGLEVGMSARTRVALRSFWEYVSFVINSLVFLLIGIEVHVSNLAESWRGILLAIGTVLLGRAVSVYFIGPGSRLMGSPIPLRWLHVLVWGGIHGSVSMALALSLRRDIPHRNEILTMTFGVVAFSIIVQGLTVKPLLRLLGIEAVREDEYDVAKARSAAYSASRAGTRFPAARPPDLAIGVRQAGPGTRCPGSGSAAGHRRHAGAERRTSRTRRSAWRGSA